MTAHRKSGDYSSVSIANGSVCFIYFLNNFLSNKSFKLTFFIDRTIQIKTKSLSFRHHDNHIVLIRQSLN
ncbi:hypothetical protein D3C85_1473560 [compost metagenome]